MHNNKWHTARSQKEQYLKFKGNFVADIIVSGILPIRAYTSGVVGILELLKEGRSIRGFRRNGHIANDLDQIGGVGLSAAQRIILIFNQVIAGNCGVSLTICNSCNGIGQIGILCDNSQLFCIGTGSIVGNIIQNSFINRSADSNSMAIVLTVCAPLDVGKGITSFLLL